MAVSAGTLVLYVAIVIFLTLLAALMSGLTLGLLSLDKVDIEIYKNSGTEREKRYARGIERLVANPHYLLVTLLVWNAAAMETMPIVLDQIVSPFVAVALSVTVVLLFGEIFPQAICSRYGIAVGYYAKYVVLCVMWLAFPVAWPIGRFLDFMLGSDHGVYRSRGQIKAFMHVHGKDTQLGGDLTKEEVTVINGALDLTHKVASVAMTPLDKVFMLSEDQVLDDECVQNIIRSGHSRIPVYGAGRHDVRGLLLVKEILQFCLLEADRTRKRVSDVALRSLPRLSGRTPMYEMLQLFKTGRAHMALLCRPAISGQLASGQLDGVVQERRLTATSNDSGDVMIAIQHETVKQPSYTNGSIDAMSTRSQPSTRNFSVTRSGGGGNGAPSPPFAGFHGTAPDGTPPALLPAELGGEKTVPIGIVTIEDIIEELMGVEIIDETDTHVDNLKTLTVTATQAAETLSKQLQSAIDEGVARASAPATPREVDHELAVLMRE